MNLIFAYAKVSSASIDKIYLCNFGKSHYHRMIYGTTRKCVFIKFNQRTKYIQTKNKVNIMFFWQCISFDKNLYLQDLVKQFM